MSALPGMEVDLVSREPCLLGEGCALSTCQRFGAWVDILCGKIFLHDFGQGTTSARSVSGFPSTIFRVSEGSVEYLSREGISTMDWASGVITTHWRWPEAHLLTSHRGNDGARLGDRYVFGSMELEPAAGTGRLFSVSDNELSVHGPIGIPNSFLPHPEGILVSDSLEKRTYLYSPTLDERKLWTDFGESGGTPDGGCVGSTGTIFLCLWGAGLIAELDLGGRLLRTLPVPAKNPTKCAQLGDALLVSSALEETTEDERQSFSLSGQTFLVKL